MKIRKAIRMAVAGAAMALPAGAVLAGSPIAFGGWSVDGSGNITAAACGTCSSTSATPVTDAGFLQRNITIGSKTFIQTVIAEADTAATADTFGSWTGGNGFADENFVEIGGTGGLSDKQQVFESVGADSFSSDAGLNTGSFLTEESITNVGTEAITNTSITLAQGVSTSGMMPFSTDFNYTEGVTTSGSNTDVFAITDIRSSVAMPMHSFSSDFAFRTKAFEGALLTDAVAQGQAYLKLDANTVLADAAPDGIQQEFHLKERSGLGAVSGPGTALATAGSATGSTLGFASGDHIVNLQVGQKVPGGGVFGLNDFVDETANAEMGSDSQSNANVPFTVVTDANGNDPFVSF